jgi:hypothetical protein
MAIRFSKSAPVCRRFKRKTGEGFYTLTCFHTAGRKVTPVFRSFSIPRGFFLPPGLLPVSQTSWSSPPSARSVRRYGLERWAMAARRARQRQTADEAGYAICAHGFPFPFSKPCRGQRKVGIKKRQAALKTVYRAALRGDYLPKRTIRVITVVRSIGEF